MKKRLFLCLLLVLMLLLTACSSSKEDNTLRILTVQTEWDQMRDQVRNAKIEFLEDHPDAEVIIETLPDNYLELEIRLDQLRVEIMAGKGPDVFIFPAEQSTASWVYTCTAKISKTLLFPDVNQAIRNGHFLDISEQYDSDTELGKEALNTKVMDAGLYEGMRVLLPLRYDLPVYVVDTERLEEIGKDLEWLANTDVISMMEDAIAADDPILAGCSFPGLLWRGKMLSYFYDRFDYQTGNLDLTMEELAELIAKADTMENMCGDREYNWGTKTMDYIGNGLWVKTGKYPIKQMLLQEAVDQLSISKTTGESIAVLPCRMVDGSVVAHVTWYGAVGSACDNVDLAYDFLRIFLTEEYQWEQNRPQSVSRYSDNLLNYGMVEEGYPVRDRGAAQYVGKLGTRSVGDRFRGGGGLDPDYRQRLGSFYEILLTDEDLPFLDFEIDAVRLPTTMERSFWIEICLGKDEYGNPIYSDYTEMAEEILKQLRYQLAEG